MFCSAFYEFWDVSCSTVDLAVAGTVRTEPESLFVGNVRIDQPCRGNASRQSITVSWNTSYPFKWMRIRAENLGKLCLLIFFVLVLSASSLFLFLDLLCSCFCIFFVFVSGSLFFFFLLLGLLRSCFRIFFVLFSVSSLFLFLDLIFFLFLDLLCSRFWISFFFLFLYLFCSCFWILCLVFSLFLSDRCFQ